MKPKAFLLGALLLASLGSAHAQSSPAMTQAQSAQDLSAWAGRSASPEEMKQQGVAAFQGGAGVVVPGAVGAAENRRQNLTLQPGDGSKEGLHPGEVPPPGPGKPAGKGISALIYGGSALLEASRARWRLPVGRFGRRRPGPGHGLLRPQGRLRRCLRNRLGSIVGTFFGGPIGGLIGAAVGGVIGHFVGKLFE